MQSVGLELSLVVFFAIKLGIDVAFGALVWLVDIVMLPVGLAGVEIL